MNILVSGIGEYICGLQSGKAREKLEIYMRHLSELSMLEECKVFVDRRYDGTNK